MVVAIIGILINDSKIRGTIKLLDDINNQMIAATVAARLKHFEER